MPIQKDEYDYFIDLSSDEYSIFECCYFIAEPYRWYKRYIVNNLNDLLIAVDNPEFDLENYKNRNDVDHWSQFNRFLEEHMSWGLGVN